MLFGKASWESLDVNDAGVRNLARVAFGKVRCVCVCVRVSHLCRSVSYTVGICLTGGD